MIYLIYVQIYLVCKMKPLTNNLYSSLRPRNNHFNIFRNIKKIFFDWYINIFGLHNESMKKSTLKHHLGALSCLLDVEIYQVYNTSQHDDLCNYHFLWKWCLALVTLSVGPQLTRVIYLDCMCQCIFRVRVRSMLIEYIMVKRTFS